VFGWGDSASPMGEGQPDYHEFKLDGRSIAGAWEIGPQMPAEVPSYWAIYFDVDDVERAYRHALELGGTEMVAPQEMPGGTFAFVSDPQGAAFGLIHMDAPSA
jgi:predicted enzyme related to lactoylglutathione lyase